MPEGGTRDAHGRSFTIGGRYGKVVVRAEAARAGGGVGARRALVTDHVRGIGLDVAVLAGLTAATSVVYVWTKAPLYNPFGTIDPWLYTALWTNFDQIYEAFAGTYYISRLPWIVPGYALNGIFDARSAALVLHATYFLAGGVFFYVLCRRWLGVAAAAIGYVALIGSQMYFNAHRWDYQEGGVLTYMIGAYAFSLVRTRSSLLRAASLGLGGAFAAAMVTTRILDVAYLVGLPLLYVAVTAGLPRSERLNQAARDVAAFAVGAMVLLGACGLFARLHGEDFLFFMPQVRVVQSSSGGYNQLPVDVWLPISPYFWVPLFVLLFSAVVFVLCPRRNRARRVLLAASAWLAMVYGGFAAWQFLGDGWLFNVGYYFSSFLVPTLFCLAAATAVLVGPERLSGRSALLGLVSVIAVLAPLAWIYRTDSGLHVATDYRADPYIAMFVAMGVALVLAALTRVLRLRAIAAAAVATALFASAYGVDASVTTWGFGSSDRRTGDLYDVGQKLIAYLHAEGYENELPLIWYDASDVASGVGSIQSLYYYAFTYLGVAMPLVDDTFRQRMTAWRPDRVVLLCAVPGCKGAATALGRAGYKPWLDSQAALESDGVRLWVRIYSVEQPA
jgi:hypothetical protein